MRPVWLGVFLLACHPRPPAPVAASAASKTHDEVPPDARKWYLEAVRAEVMGDLQRSQRALEWVVRLDRGSPWPQLALGRLAELEGDPLAARAAYERALKLEAVPEAHLALARLLAGSGDPAARGAFDAATTGFLDRYAAKDLAPGDVTPMMEAASGACRVAEVVAWLAARGVTPPEPDEGGCGSDGAATP